MKESTYQDLTAVQIEILIKAVESKYHNVCGKYIQIDEMRKMYKDEISKVDLEIKILEAEILNAAAGLVPVSHDKKKDRLKISTAKSALKGMAIVRELE